MKRRRTRRAVEIPTFPPAVTFQVRERSVLRAVRTLRKMMRGSRRRTAVVELRAAIWWY